MMGEGCGATRPCVTTVTGVVIVQVPIPSAAVIVIGGVAPGWGRVNGLYGDLGPGLGGGVKGLSPGVVLGPELHRGLHGDLGLLCEAVAAVGGRGTAVPGGRCTIRGRRGPVGGGWAVAAAVRTVQVGLRLDLDHTVGTGAEERQTTSDRLTNTGF